MSLKDVENVDAEMVDHRLEETRENGSVIKKENYLNRFGLNSFFKCETVHSQTYSSPICKALKALIVKLVMTRAPNWPVRKETGNSRHFLRGASLKLAPSFTES